MMRDRSRPIAAGLVAFALALTACQEETTSPDVSESSPNLAATAANYTVTDLGTLGGDQAEAFAINNAGHVVGYSQTPDLELHAFLWKNGVMRDLGTLGGPTSFAYAINAAGQVVGESSTAAGELHAFLWQNGVMRDLGTLGGDWSSARSINDLGQVVGWSRGTFGSIRAFIWEAGTMRRLGGGLEKTFGRAWSINNGGRVVGDFQRPGMTYRRAFRLKDGVMADLGTLGGNTSFAMAINGEGKVVGIAGTSPGRSHAFLWQSGVMTDLGTLGGRTSSAAAINVVGQIVGSSQISDGSYHAFVWQNGVMSRLGPGGATGINRSGWIVVNYEGHAALWKPE